jgi:heptosyltransferase III
MSRNKSSNLLIFRIGSIGDAVVSLPCFHAIARAYPQHRRILLTNLVSTARALSVEKVMNGSGLIHETLHFQPGQGRLAHSLTLLRALRRMSPEAVVYLAPRPTGWPVYRDLAFFAAAGVRKVIGAPVLARARQCAVDPHTGELEHEARRLARTLGTHLPVDLSAPNWDLRLSSTEHALAVERLARLPPGRGVLAVAPGAKIREKDWGEENWTRFIKLLEEHVPSLSLVFLGAADERQLNERLARLWAGSRLNLCGQLSPRESAAVLGRCDALVCHDSGPMHLAASRGTPCVALFGSYNRPRQWFPFGDGHRVFYEPRGVRLIPVERVVDAVKAVTVPSRPMVNILG